MMTTPAFTSRTDPESEHADLAVLRGSERTAMVEAALTGSGQFDPGRDRDLQVHVHQVHHRPGAGVSIGYTVHYTGPTGAVRDYVVASTSPQARSGDGVALLDDGVRQIRMWRRPFDPSLPGLRGASDPAVVRSWLDRAGLDVPGPVQVRSLSYRPTRRSVLRATSGDQMVFLKVLPERKMNDLVARHDLLEAAGVPAPRVLARPDPGVCVLSAARGAPMAQAIAGAGQHPENLPPPSDLVRWLDLLPPQTLQLPARPSWSDRLDFHAAAAAAALPEHQREITDLGARLADALAAVRPEEEVPTHGDYYEANVFTAGGQVSDVIDIDSLGPGRRSDDLATMLGHVAVLPDLAPKVYTHTPGVIAALQADFETRVPAHVLRVRTAAVVLSLIAGASDDQARARLRIATEWARAAVRTRSGANSNLRVLSSTSPAPLIDGPETATRHEHH